MRTSTAYFAGVGTVMAAVVAGLGGGLLISNIVSPHEPRIEMSKLELRMSERPIPATNVSSEPAPGTTSTLAKPTEVPAAENVTASAPPMAPPQAAAPVTQAATAEKASSEQIKTPEAAFAKARDSDMKVRDADLRREARRAAEEKRKVERRPQWVERRRPRQDQELRDVEAKVREETEPRQVFAAEPVKLEMPRIKLFEAE